MSNPNAGVAGGTTGLGVLVVWLVGNVFHQTISAEAGVIVAGAITTLALFVGREGLGGIWQTIKHGRNKPPPVVPPAPPAAPVP